MNKTNIRDFFFTLSGFMSTSFNFIKAKYKLLLPVYLIFAVITYVPMFLFFKNNNIASNLSTGNMNINQAISILLSMTVMIILMIIVSFFIHAFISGIIYTQSRAYVDDCEFSIKDSLSYTLKRLGSYTTVFLSEVLIYFGVSVAFTIFLMLGGLIAGLSMTSSQTQAFAIIFFIIAFIGYFALAAACIYIALKLLFSYQVALNYNCGGFNAINYSNELTKGSKGTLFGYMMLFIAINLGISIVVSIFTAVTSLASSGLDVNNFSSITTSPGISILSYFLTSLISIFSMIYFNFVFINFDSVKKRNAYFYPNQNRNPNIMMYTQDFFYEYCLTNQIKTQYAPNGSIDNSQPIE